MGTSGIQEKVVVITGASSGLGESTAKLLARHGAKVVLGARRKDRLDAVVSEISAAGGKAIRFAVDVTKRVEVEALIKKAVESFGRVDVLVNNAGIMPIAPIHLLKVEEWDRQIDINIKGVLYGVAAVLPQMQKQKSGHIINMASVFGIKVFAPRRDGVLRHEIRRARLDRRTSDGATCRKHPLHDHLAWCGGVGTEERNL
jgi:NADP-dependent 3-hydroxy acid dehydrogenase YdfG